MTNKVSFKLPAEYVADAVSGVLVGEFNNWNPEEGIFLQKQDDGSMVAELALTAGKTYEYRYLLSDGRWVNDLSTKKSSDVYGNPIENCVIDVPEIVLTETVEPAVPAMIETVESVIEPLGVETDDLTKIEGISKKVAALLIEKNIKTYKDISKASIKKLQLILDGAGSKFGIHNPANWPKQARLAAAGKWEALNKLQAELIAGK